VAPARADLGGYTVVAIAARGSNSEWLRAEAFIPAGFPNPPNFGSSRPIATEDIAQRMLCERGGGSNAIWFTVRYAGGSRSRYAVCMTPAAQGANAHDGQDRQERNVEPDGAIARC
jgi:hypothetical protein